LLFVTDAHEASPERLDAVERDARELLSAAGFDADECPVVRGTGPVEPKRQTRSWKRGAEALREALDDVVPYVDLDPTFAMQVDDVFNIRGRGTVVTGQVQRGTVRVGDSVDILRPAARTTVKVTGIEMIRRLVDSARPPDNVGLLARLVRPRRRRPRRPAR
jgi:elongation factor Tu